MKLQFVIAGRPNKGKSSVVSTLARSEDVAISARSGTTTHSESYEVSLGTDGFVLVDTPGIQRPSKVLAWLQQHAAAIDAGADRREQVVEAFLADPANQALFPDEVDVLGSIMRRAGKLQTAAIIYVVDGSVPYHRSYEAEMAILQWTGRLSMAVINPIESDHFVEQWRAALNQYFKLVRVFNAHFDDSDSQVRLLEDFSHIDPSWQLPLGRIIAAIREQARKQARLSAAVAAELLDELCRFEVRQKVPTRPAAEKLRPVLARRYFASMRATEAGALDELQTVYRHQQTARKAEPLQIAEDLFDTRHWALWGLGRRGLLIAGASAGAVLGAGADLVAAGLSLGTGATLGALLGAGGAWLGADRLVTLRLRGLPTGGYEACQGPVSSSNFPYVVLGRFLIAHRLLRSRNHARRDSLELQESDIGSEGASPLEAAIKTLDANEQKALHRAMQRLSRQKTVENLVGILLPLFDRPGQES